MILRPSLPSALLALSVVACSASAGSPERAVAPAAAHAATQALPRLVFFMNPNGVPCQMQDRVLRTMAAESLNAVAPSRRVAAQYSCTRMFHAAA